MKQLRLEYSPPEEGCPYWAASFPDLLVFAQGETFGEAIENLREALQLWVEDLLERGTLEEALKESGLEELYSKGFADAITHGFIPPSFIERAQCHV